MSQALRTKENVAFAPGQVLRVYGMRRSGNHALINWIMRNAPNGHGVFLNDCRPKTDPVVSCSGVSVFEDGVDVDMQVGRQQKLQRAGALPFTVVSYEDRVPPTAPKPLYAAPETLIIIYRSFLHWTASLLRKVQGNEGYGPLDRNRIMGRALGTYSEMLTRVQEDDVVPLCYDDWTADAHYREEALSRLKLPGRDLSLGTVQRYGGGSSFQDATAASDLTTDKRSAQMADDHEYQMLLWTAARDEGFMTKLTKVFPADANRLDTLRSTASAQVVLP
ncbi:hypothetical protein KUV51_12705 [Tateyamaria omphalii]|uniref:hypothetical protein n=1 Tax=Tateyamaria omphalii TaxID=299262 RepID=UPI001C993151|nr:hypothetical protein [Tateyamaria omphalii]MBY5933863.1 hypothetical protein [Tateyamaria omphalii]